MYTWIECKELLHGHIEVHTSSLVLVRSNLEAMKKAGTITNWREHEILYLSRIDKPYSFFRYSS